MRDRILSVIALFPEDDPFAADIHYHKKCWDRYISNLDKKKCREHVESVSRKEVEEVFIDHVQRTICQQNEPRTLKTLLDYYDYFLYDLRGEEKEYKTSYVKDLISAEFKEQILFHERYQKNESTLVLNRSGGGSFLESALNSWGLPIEELLHNVARHVNDEAEKIDPMPWPPTFANLSEECSQNIFVKFVGWLKRPEKKEAEVTPEVLAIASLLQSLVTNKRTKFQVLWTNMIYGLTRSRELVDMNKKFGFGISYQDVKNLLAT